MNTNAKKLGAIAERVANTVQQSTAQPNNRAKSIISGRTNLLADISAGERHDLVHLFVDPSTCRMWRRHNRDYSLLSKNSCSDLIDRIRQDGQKTPAIVRRLHNDPDYEFEVIAGARRHFSVSYLRNVEGREEIKYKVEVQEVSDQEAFILSDIENRDRMDISDVERGLDYLTALNEFYDDNISEMAEAITLSRQKLSNYLNLAKLPKEILAAYADKRNIALRHGTMILPWLNDKTKREAVLEKASKVSILQQQALKVGGALQYDGIQVLRELEKAITPRKTLARKKPNKEALRVGEGPELGTVERGKKYTTIRIENENLNLKKELLAALRKVL